MDCFGEFIEGVFSEFNEVILGGVDFLLELMDLGEHFLVVLSEFFVLKNFLIEILGQFRSLDFQLSEL